MPRPSTIIGLAFIALCIYAADHQTETRRYFDQLERGFISSIHFG